MGAFCADQSLAMIMQCASTPLPPEPGGASLFPTRSMWHCSVRLSPIAENSPLLPPVGVWSSIPFCLRSKIQSSVGADRDRD